jgi:hypothetical protein
MAKFITNIQLLDAVEKDYETLGKEMKKESFTSEAHAAKSKAYVTGKAVYSMEGTMGIQKVIGATVRAASRLGKKFSFFVMKDKPVGSLHS